MTASSVAFGSFSVGDYVLFERSFSPADFEAFSRLSGDKNPLHHSREFAQKSTFQRPIVPLHLTLAPLSMIAGMVFPGQSSLYLGHEVRASKPVYYDEPLQYSARIESINGSHSVLGLRVLAFRGTEVVLDAAMRVQALVPEWEAPPLLPIRKGNRPSMAVITGASGEIGSAVALLLAKAGWRLLLQGRNEGRRKELEARLARVNASAAWVSADLRDAGDRARFCDVVRTHEDIGVVLHAASPSVDAPIEDLVAVNFTALQEVADAALPGMLARQGGTVLFVGSAATERALTGWECYSAAKSMGTNLLNGVERNYGLYGIRGMTIMPGMVATKFSAAYQRDDVQVLLPEEVGEAIVFMLAQDPSSGNVLLLEPGFSRLGRTDFHAVAHAPSSPAASAGPRPAQLTAVTGGDATLASLVRRFFRMGPAEDLSDARLGGIPGWDSLRHIELLLDVEKNLGVQFQSAEIELTHSFEQLDLLCAKKLQGKQIG